MVVEGGMKAAETIIADMIPQRMEREGKLPKSARKEHRRRVIFLS